MDYNRDYTGIIDKRYFTGIILRHNDIRDFLGIIHDYTRMSMMIIISYPLIIKSKTWYEIWTFSHLVQ